MSDVATIRGALNEALREAAADKGQDGEDSWWRQDHPWCQPDDGDGNGDTDCAAHKEIQNCCLDPNHGAYDRLLDYLAERVASKLMYRGGAVTNVVATIGEEIQPSKPDFLDAVLAEREACALLAILQGQEQVNAVSPNAIHYVNASNDIAHAIRARDGNEPFDLELMREEVRLFWVNIETEACAKIADAVVGPQSITGAEIARRIRARSEP